VVQALVIGVGDRLGHLFDIGARALIQAVQIAFALFGHRTRGATKVRLVGGEVGVQALQGAAHQIGDAVDILELAVSL
jgi:hypothetical protein